MSSREAILQRIRANRPAPTPLPERLPHAPPEADLAEHFTRVLREIGCRVELLENGSAAETLCACYPEAMHIASAAAQQVEGTVDLAAVADPHRLADLDLLVCEGELGVAENGAIWVPESRLLHRAAPFIAQHLAILLDRRHLVWDLREAYQRIRVDGEGYGVFIAGPSKTADIEQSLVIGAHGPRSLTVLLR